MQRLQQRAAQGGHFMPPQLLASQLAALDYEEEELLLHVRPAAVDGGDGGCTAGGGAGSVETGAVQRFPSAGEIVEQILAHTK